MMDKVLACQVFPLAPSQDRIEQNSVLIQHWGSLHDTVAVIMQTDGKLYSLKRNKIFVVQGRKNKDVEFYMY